MRIFPWSGLARPVSPAMVLVLAGILDAGCATSESHGRFDRHFESSVLSGALDAQWERQDRRIPELGLLAAVPLAFAVDSDFNEDRPKDINSSEKTAADTIPIALGLGSLALGTRDWMHGDHGEGLEASTEALVAVTLLTQVLKKSVGRDRPDKEADSSFPSGHTSFAFAGTTLILRQLDDEQDPSWKPWQTLAYVPALFVAAERVRSDRHWTSDVAVGAFLGTFVANWVWDAHFARGDEDRRTVFGRDRMLAWRWGIDSVDGRPAIGLSLSF